MNLYLGGNTAETMCTALDVVPRKPISEEVAVTLPLETGRYLVPDLLDLLPLLLTVLEKVVLSTQAPRARA